MNLVHTPAQARRFDAFDAVAGDFLKMFCVAVMSGFFFSLVAGLVVFLIASNTYASPPQEGTSATVAVQTLRGGRLLLAADQQFRIPFAAGNGALNLMIELESAADAVTTSDPSAAIERVGATHVVSLINRPLPRDFEMRWTAPSKIARSALVE